ncbi:APC family permease [Cryptosporangium aurantiacum]|uniref:Amino acid transporter n=1 Tax=Cryptosporangium aurantiacum TaxID=134849 RepID=A0A1M7RMQ6_9ACTN|nr:APC family permease [Cryptosporangium aurantiacum]SHN47593.1 Amino acid transporter [Cryptosporangium aurantiacum]
MARHVPETAATHEGTLAGWQLAIVATMSHAPLIVAWVAIPGAFQFGHVVAMPLVYVLGGFALLCAALAFTSMARRVRHPGGLYALVTHGLGPAIGLGVAGVVLISYLGSLVSLYAVFGLVLSGLSVDILDVNLPSEIAAVLGVIAVSLLSMVRLRRVIWLLGGLLVAQIVVLVWFDVRALQLPMASEDFTAPLHPGWLFSGSFGVALCFAVTAFIGLDTSLNFVRDVREPRRSVPRAAYVAGIVMTTASALSAWAVGAATSGQARAAVAPDDVATTAGTTGQSLFTLIARIVGPEEAPGVARLIMFTLLLATVGTAVVLHKAVNRQLSGLAMDGVLPAAFRLGAPGVWHVRAVVPALAAIGAVAVIATDDRVYALWLGLVSGLGITGALALTSVGALVWFLRSDEDESELRGWEFRAVAGAVAAVVTGFVFIFGLLRLSSVFPPADGRPSWLLAALIGAAFTAGLVAAAMLKASRPAVYASIGRFRSNNDDSDAKEPAVSGATWEPRFSTGVPGVPGVPLDAVPAQSRPPAAEQYAPSPSAPAPSAAAPYGAAPTSPAPSYGAAPTTPAPSYGAAPTSPAPYAPELPPSAPYAPQAVPPAAAPLGPAPTSPAPYAREPYAPEPSSPAPFASEAAPFAPEAAPYASEAAPYASEAAPYASEAAPYASEAAPPGAGPDNHSWWGHRA